MLLYTMYIPFFVYQIINHLILQYAHMLRYFCLTLLICLNLTSFAQSYIGFGADNFNGVHGILTNPANIADSRSRIDINLISASEFSTIRQSFQGSMEGLHLMGHSIFGVAFCNARLSIIKTHKFAVQLNPIRDLNSWPFMLSNGHG